MLKYSTRLSLFGRCTLGIMHTVFERNELVQNNKENKQTRRTKLR